MIEWSQTCPEHLVELWTLRENHMVVSQHI